MEAPGVVRELSNEVQAPPPPPASCAHVICLFETCLSHTSDNVVATCYLLLAVATPIHWESVY